MVQTLKTRKDISLAYCDSQIFDLQRNPYYVFTFEPYNYMELMESQGRIPTGSFVFRTECWRQIDGFREDMIRGEDFEWQLRMGEFFDFLRYPQILHYYFRDKDGLIHDTSRRGIVKEAMTVLQQTKDQIKIRKFR